MEYPNITQDKLIILYIINKLNKSITNLQMVDLILETTGIDYFSLQELLLNLTEKSLIFLIHKDDIRYYKITDEGNNLLSSLISLVPDFIIKRINDKIRTIQKKVEQKEIIYADYFPEDDNNFMVKCKISESDNILIELNLNVPSKAQAIDICNKWYANPSKYYSEIINAFNK
jgi:predicted transcriptional regulator